MDNQGASLESEDLLYLNGVDALTGGPLRDAPSVEQIVALAEAEFTGTARTDREELKALSDLKSNLNYGTDVDDLSDLGVARWRGLRRRTEPDHPSGPSAAYVILITWLGIVYNTYWSQLMNATDPKTIQKDLEAITRTALKDLRALATAQGELSRQRPDLPNLDGPPPADQK